MDKLKDMISGSLQANKAWMMRALPEKAPKSSGGVVDLTKSPTPVASAKRAKMTRKSEVEELMTHLQQGWDATSQLSADAVQLAQRIQKDQQETAANHALAKQTFELLKKAALPSQDILSFLSSELESIDVDKAQSALSTMSEVFLFYLILCSHGSIKQSCL